MRTLLVHVRSVPQAAINLVALEGISQIAVKRYRAARAVNIGLASAARRQANASCVRNTSTVPVVWRKVILQRACRISRAHLDNIEQVTT